MAPRPRRDDGASIGDVDSSWREYSKGILLLLLVLLLVVGVMTGVVQATIVDFLGDGEATIIADTDADERETAATVEGQTIISTEQIQTIESGIYNRTNAKRSTANADRLVFSGDLSRVARSYSQQMATEGFFSHTSPSGTNAMERVSMADIKRCKIVGENLAQTWWKQTVTTVSGVETYTTFSELSQGVVAQFMNSPGHRENMLRPEWGEIGVGTAITTDGKVYVTQIFCRV